MKHIMNLFSLLCWCSLAFGQSHTADIGLHYDRQGRLDQIVHPGTNGGSGVVQQHSYSASLRQNTVSIDGRTIVGETRYFGHGGAQQITFGNTTAPTATAHINYDGLLRYRDVALNVNNREVYAARNHSYNVQGSVAGFDRFDDMGQHRISHSFDSHGRLESFGYGDRLDQFQYDSRGNLTRHQIDGQSVYTAAFGAGNDYHHDDWDHDQSGRVSTDTRYNYEYDGFGNLRVLRDIHTGAVLEHHLYDSNGNRVRTMDGEKVDYSYRLEGVMISQQSRDSQGALIQQSDFALYNDRATAELKTDAAGAESLEYSFTDRSGSPAYIWDESGTGKYHQYTPFGEFLDEDGIEEHVGAHGFTGHEDDISGLTYMRARYYDAEAARFLTPDPARDFDPHLATTYNLYQYVHNNPVAHVDPTGKWLDTLIDVVGVAIATVEYIQDPSAENAAALALEVTAAVVPGLPSPKAVALAGEAISAAADYVKGARKASKTACFVAGTLVTTQAGLVAIEDIQPGDQVWSRDEETGAEAWKTVINAFSRPVDDIHALTLTTPDGVNQHFEVTSEHPYWVEPGLWREVKDLKPGDRVWSRSGWSVVVHNRILPSSEMVYNFTVEDFHTYFVGKTAVWVHNTCNTRIPDDQEIVMAGNANPGNLMIRKGKDDRPIKDVTDPGKSASKAIDSDPRNETKRMFGRAKAKGNIISVTTAGEIRAAGFDVVNAGTAHNPNHVRIIAGENSFDDKGREALSEAFKNEKNKKRMAK